MITVKIIPNEKGNPPGKLADVELHFKHTIAEEGALQHEPSDFVDADAILDGLKLIGFSIWEKHNQQGKRMVAFPARQYSINGERRSFALLRPIGLDAATARHDLEAQNRVRDLILDAYVAWEEQ